MTQAQQEYIAGVCNIGPEESTRRRQFGWATLVITLMLIVALMWTGVNPWWRLFVFLPATMSASGFLQARLHFCSGYASRGVFNLGAIGHTHPVTDESSRAKDSKRGRQITLYAALIGAAVTIIAVLV